MIVKSPKSICWPGKLISSNHSPRNVCCMDQAQLVMVNGHNISMLDAHSWNSMHMSSEMSRRTEKLAQEHSQTLLQKVYAHTDTWESSAHECLKSTRASGKALSSLTFQRQKQVEARKYKQNVWHLKPHSSTHRIKDHPPPCCARAYRLHYWPQSPQNP